MINRILERLEEQEKFYKVTEDCDSLELPQNAYYKGMVKGFEYAINTVQEVAKEYGRIHLNRCDTCIHYTSEEIVPPICYFCCKGMEDNYKAREEEA